MMGGAVAAAFYGAGKLFGAASQAIKSARNGSKGTVNSFGAGYNGAEYDDLMRRGVTGRATVNQFNPRLNMNLGFFGNKGSGKPYSGTRNPSSDFTNAKGNSTLKNHFDRHVSGFSSANNYLNSARYFLEKPTTSTTQSFISNKVTYFRYDTETNKFGIMNKYDRVSTYYKPDTGLRYWLEQIKLYAPK